MPSSRPTRIAVRQSSRPGRAAAWSAGYQRTSRRNERPRTRDQTARSVRRDAASASVGSRNTSSVLTIGRRSTRATGRTARVVNGPPQLGCGQTQVVAIRLSSMTWHSRVRASSSFMQVLCAECGGAPSEVLTEHRPAGAASLQRHDLSTRCRSAARFWVWIGSHSSALRRQSQLSLVLCPWSRSGWRITTQTGSPPDRCGNVKVNSNSRRRSAATKIDETP